jgi:arylsulfatase A-like enzyme
MKRTMYWLIVTMTFVLTGITTATAQQNTPNIVWITIEDTSPDFIGCYGNKQAKTPNIDALAAEGIRFTNAFSTNTVCSPSRHTIITGVRTAQDGCGNHRSSFKIPSYVKGFASYLKSAGYFTSNNSKTDYNINDPQPFIQQNWTEQGGKADFTNRRDKVQAFFSIFNVNESHQSRTLTNSFGWYEREILSKLSTEEIIRPDGLEIPPFYKQNDNNRKNMARVYNCLQATDKGVGRIVQSLKASGEWDNTIVFFFSDHGQGMPRFKTNSSRLGYQVPFIVRVPEKYKHLMKVAPGNTYDELVTFEDLAPTIINIATGSLPPAYMKGRVFLGNKVTPTDNVFWGSRDNTDEVVDMNRTVIKGDFVYTRIYYPHLPVLQQYAYFNRSDMLKEMRHDYLTNELDSLQASIFNPRSAEYLFNRKEDKWETTNLAANKKYADILKIMRNLNQEKIRSYSDVGFLPEAVIAEINKKDTLLIWKKKNYNVSDYLKVAEMVGMGKSFLPKQMALLAHKDQVIRYWAAIGLRNQATKDLNRESLQKTFEAERSDLVKVEIGDLLYHHFHDENALSWMADLVSTSSNPYVVREAVIKLANRNDLPVAVVEKIKKIREAVLVKHKSDMSYPIRAALGTITNINVEEDTN